MLGKVPSLGKCPTLHYPRPGNEHLKATNMESLISFQSTGPSNLTGPLMPLQGSGPGMEMSSFLKKGRSRVNKSVRGVGQ